MIKELKETVSQEKQLTENGAVGYVTSGKALLDLNFAVSSMRNWPEQQIIDKFMDAFYEDKITAMKWLAYLSDIRGGLGERRTFCVIFKYLANNHPDIAKAILHLIPLYSRWDYLFKAIDSPVEDDMIQLIITQLEQDTDHARAGETVSLLAKWMPSEQASSKKTKGLAELFTRKLKMSRGEYRKMLSSLRARLDIVERKMSAKQWSEIKYESVPSKANLIYNVAFLRNDEERRRAYLAALDKGETKINSAVLFPHDIVHKYSSDNYWSNRVKVLDPALEAMWKSLPDYVEGAGNVLTMLDGSGSMTSRIGGTEVTALEVANALGVYFSERCSGEFKDTYITFSNRPRLVDLSAASTLHDKLEIAYRHNEVADTNIEAAFMLILNTAVSHKMKREDMPKTLLIMSDMEFNQAVIGRKPDAALFDELSNRFSDCGYSMPRLVFWNIMSRTGTIPVQQNAAGVALVSGFSPAVCKMVLSSELDPYKCLLKQLNTERYQPVEDCLKDVI